MECDGFSCPSQNTRLARLRRPHQGFAAPPNPPFSSLNVPSLPAKPAFWEEKRFGRGPNPCAAAVGTCVCRAGLRLRRFLLLLGREEILDLRERGRGAQRSAGTPRDGPGTRGTEQTVIYSPKPRFTELGQGEVQRSGPRIHMGTVGVTPVSPICSVQPPRSLWSQRAALLHLGL